MEMREMEKMGEKRGALALSFPPSRSYNKGRLTGIKQCFIYDSSLNLLYAVSSYFILFYFIFE